MTPSRVSQFFRFATLALLITLASFPILAQQTTTTNAVVPNLVNFSGTLRDVSGKPLTGIVGVTFYLYQDQQGGTPLWMETQNVQPDTIGHYSVMLGLTTSQGLSPDLFASGQARWLGVQAQGQEEQPRVMLLSVPYAMKAVDAQTVGGLPPSAFVLAAPPTSNPAIAANVNETPSVTPATSSDVTTTGGKAATIPMFTAATNIQNSLLTQTGTTAINVLGKLNLPALGTATASAGFKSRPLDFVASVFNSNTANPVPQTFQWQAEPLNNNKSTATGTLNLLYATGTATPAETGLHIASNGLVTFATGQTFPGTGPGTITGVTAGTDLTGGGTSGSVTLNLDTTKVPRLAAANAFTGNQAVNGNLSATGMVTGSAYQIGSNLFAFGSHANGNAFLGFAGNTTMTGTDNTATGLDALYSNTSGILNTATGLGALHSNTTGYSNTAIGLDALYSNTVDNQSTAVGAYAAFSFNDTTGYEVNAFGFQALYSETSGYNDAFGYQTLYSNTTGSYNEAFGYQALYSNTTGEGNTAVGNSALYGNFNGFGNTAVGAYALESNSTGSRLTCIGYGCTASASALTNATAIGAHAVVGQSNSLVLGGTGQYSVKVGIGTTTPSNIFTVGRGAGHPVSDSWETYSSRRWKTNIQPLQNALNKVAQLRGVSYDLKDSGKHEIGVIAEEVGKVVPEVVSFEDNGKDARGVDYSRLTALLIEAVKQQQAVIRKQQVQIVHLAAEVREIKTSLKARSEVRTVKAQAPMVRQ